MGNEQAPQYGQQLGYPYVQANQATFQQAGGVPRANFQQQRQAGQLGRSGQTGQPGQAGLPGQAGRVQRTGLIPPIRQATLHDPDDPTVSWVPQPEQRAAAPWAPQGAPLRQGGDAWRAPEYQERRAEARDEQAIAAAQAAQQAQPQQAQPQQVQPQQVQYEQPRTQAQARPEAHPHVQPQMQKADLPQPDQAQAHFADLHQAEQYPPVYKLPDWEQAHAAPFDEQPFASAPQTAAFPPTAQQAYPAPGYQQDFNAQAQREAAPAPSAYQAQINLQAPSAVEVQQAFPAQPAQPGQQLAYAANAALQHEADFQHMPEQFGSYQQAVFPYVQANLSQQAPGMQQMSNVHPVPGFQQAPSMQEAPGVQAAPGPQQTPGAQPAPGLQQVPGAQQAPGLQQAPGMQAEAFQQARSFGTPRLEDLPAFPARAQQAMYAQQSAQAQRPAQMQRQPEFAPQPQAAADRVPEPAPSQAAPAASADDKPQASPSPEAMPQAIAAPPIPNIDAPSPARESKGEKPVSLGNWFGSLLVAAIPVVGLIVLIVWSFASSTPKSKKNWARAMLIWYVIAIAISALVAALGIVNLNAIYNTYYTYALWS